MVTGKDYEKLREIFSTRSEECEGCPFFLEWEERLSWLHNEEEGRVMCEILGGADASLEDCQIIEIDKAANEATNQGDEDED